NTSVADPCSNLQHLPLHADALRTGNRQRVAIRGYHYDAFGNLHRYISPAAADGHFVSRRIQFDPFLHLVEMAEHTDYCQIGATGPVSGECLPGSVSALGTFISLSGDVDWRHAIATTQVDINRNAIRTMVDGVGRPTAVFASWAGIWADKPDCAKGECTSLPAEALKPTATWGKLLAYAYRVARDLEAPTSIARITRY